MYGDLFYGDKGFLLAATFILCVCIPTKAYAMKMVIFSVITCIIFVYSEGYGAYIWCFEINMALTNVMVLHFSCLFLASTARGPKGVLGWLHMSLQTATLTSLMTPSKRPLMMMY